MGLEWCSSDGKRVHRIPGIRLCRSRLLDYCLTVVQRSLPNIRKEMGILKAFNPQKERIPHFAELSETRRVTCRTKILEGLPDTMPHGFAKYHLEGCWILIDEIPCAQPVEGTLLRNGSIRDLERGLGCLWEAWDNPELLHTWVADLRKFLCVSLEKGDRYLILKDVQ